MTPRALSSAGPSARRGRFVSGDRPPVRGRIVDEETRCVHYGSARDVVAIEFACCREFYPCHLCHEETAGHPAARWSLEQYAERALLCGRCGHRFTIAEYADAEACAACAGEFNPGCRLHWDLYFAR